MAALLTASCSHDDDGYWDFPPAGLPDYSYFRTGWDQASLQIDSSATAQTVFLTAHGQKPQRSAEPKLFAGNARNVNTEATVNDFIIGTPQSALDYQAVQSRREKKCHDYRFSDDLPPTLPEFYARIPHAFPVGVLQ